jgi:hypothetical protein
MRAVQRMATVRCSVWMTAAPASGGHDGLPGAVVTGGSGGRIAGDVMLRAAGRERTEMRIAWRKRLAAGAAAAAAAIAAGPALTSCSPAPGASASATSRGGVVSLTAIAGLRSLFNRDNGHPRLVLIFSPT